MRKHKSVVAILLAVMMIFTFMPTMAFAETEHYTFKWSDDLKSATVVENGATANVSMAFDDNGMTTVTAVYGNSSDAVYFYDFTGASIKLNSSMPWSEFNNKVIYGTPEITMVKPTGATGSNTATFNGNNAWYAYFDYDEAFEGGGDTEVKVKLESLNSLDHDGSEVSQAAKFGSVASKTVTVAAPSETVDSFYEIVDGKKIEIDIDSENYYNPSYDGSEHTIYAPEMAYQSIKYQKYSDENGKWEDVNAITYKDATSSAVEYRALYTSTDVSKAPSFGPLYLTIYVDNSDKQPSYAWTAPNARESSIIFGPEERLYYYEVTASQAEDPTAFIEIASGFTKEPAKSVDLEEIKAVFNELYKVTVTKNAIDENIQTWTIEQKATDADWSKLLADTQKAHKTLFANYNLENGFNRYGYATMNVKVLAAPVVNDKDDDISFEGQTKFVYSGKKTTKKGVLKAKKTIKVKATADSGNAITYVATKTAAGKITVSKAGKITVKKGLKKGTYKVTVKAKTAAGNGYKAAKEKQTYTIVIKK